MTAPLVMSCQLSKTQLNLHLSKLHFRLFYFTRIAFSSTGFCIVTNSFEIHKHSRKKTKGLRIFSASFINGKILFCLLNVCSSCQVKSKMYWPCTVLSL